MPFVLADSLQADTGAIPRRSVWVSSSPTLAMLEWVRKRAERASCASICDDLIEIAVGGGLRDAMIMSQRIGARAVAEPSHALCARYPLRSGNYKIADTGGLPEAAQRPAPRSYRSAASSFAADNTTSLGRSRVAR